jgi:hypothetical protein
MEKSPANALLYELTATTTDAFRNTMNAALGRAKDGEGLASAVKPILAT